MVVAANSRAHTNHRTFDFSGAEVVNPGAGMLAVLLDIEKTPAAGERTNSFAALLLRGVKPGAASMRTYLLENFSVTARHYTDTICMVFAGRVVDKRQVTAACEVPVSVF
jgi:hypothetical protein